MLLVLASLLPLMAEDEVRAPGPDSTAPAEEAAEEPAPDQRPDDALPGAENGEPHGTPGIPAPQQRDPAEIYRDYEDVRLSASVDNSRPSIGDWVTLELTAEGPEGIEFKRAELPEKLPDYLALKYRAAPDAKVSEGRVTKVWNFTLDFFFTGKFPLPPVVVTYTTEDGKERQLLSSVFFLDIQDLPLDPENPEDIRPNRSMAEVQVNYRKFYLIGGCVIAAIAFLAVGVPLLVRWWRRPEELPPVPPHVIAYEQMRKLIEDRLPENGKIEEYYVRLSDICRHYLENRFGLRAPEMTTEEFLMVMAETNFLAEAHKNLVREFLEHCDLVKFAKYGPSTEEMEEAFAAAKRLVDETREHDEEDTDLAEEVEPVSEEVVVTAT